MKVIYSEKHILHVPSSQIIAGIPLEAVEIPERIEGVVQSLMLGDHDIISPRSYGMDSILQVHSQDYINYLANIYSTWREQQPFRYGVIPNTFSFRVHGRKPRGEACLAGWYCFDTATPILENTFEAAMLSAACALTGAELLVDGDRFVYALCRPPGHHAGSDYCGGFCYLNNVAIAAKHLINISPNCNKIAILDIDYHHGNGTQEIFYKSDQVLYVSIHSDPNDEYPYFWGYPDEIGKDEGIGTNLNIPLFKGADENVYIDALKIAVEKINHFNPYYVLISFGVDTLIDDPAGGFKLSIDTYGRIGELISTIDKPVLILQEGGYLIESMGRSVVNFLEGIDHR